jgi:hypothetical protein
LLSIARLHIARSRRRPSNWRRTRIVQTSLDFSGRFWPISLPLFHGARGRDALCVRWSWCSPTPPRPPQRRSPSISSASYRQRAQSRR